MERQRVFIQIGVIVATAPMIAPILGGWIIKLLSWHWIFVLQTLLGTIALIGVLMMEESLTPQEPPRRLYRGCLKLPASVRQRPLLFPPADPELSLHSGVRLCRRIVGDLHSAVRVQRTAVRLFFSASIPWPLSLAPLTFSRAVRSFSILQLMPLAFIGMLLGSLLLLCPWIPPPWRLSLPMFCLTFCFSFCRPAGNNLILEQVDRDTGAASSLMVFFYFMGRGNGRCGFSPMVGRTRW